MTSKNDNNIDQLIQMVATYIFGSTGRDSVDRVLVEIIGGFLSKKFKPGQRLVAARIAEELSISIAPVREAMHMLAGQGIIELLPQKGARIRPMTRKEAEAWWHIFCLITQLGVRMAAERVGESEENVGIVKDALNNLAAVIDGSQLEFSIYQLDFHRRLNAFSGAMVVDQASRALQVVYWKRCMEDYIPFEHYRGDLFEGYRRMADAILAGDGESAASIFGHYTQFCNALIRGERPEPGKPWKFRSEGLEFSIGNLDITKESSPAA